MPCRVKFLALALAALLPLLPASARAEDATGSVTYQGRTLLPKYVYLVKGPDAVDPTLILRELVFSATDLGATIDACKSMSCISSELMDGMTVDLDAGPRLNYWVVMNGQRVQYSGTARPATLEARVDEPGKLAGQLRIDDTGSGGPKVDVEFDVALRKTLSAAR